MPSRPLCSQMPFPGKSKPHCLHTKQTDNYSFWLITVTSAAAISLQLFSILEEQILARLTKAKKTLTTITTKYFNPRQDPSGLDKLSFWLNVYFNIAIINNNPNTIHK